VQKKNIIFHFLIFLLLTPAAVQAQIRYSLTTDISAMRNFDGKQPFTVPGQSVGLQWHPDKRYSLYSYFTYHGHGRYLNNLQANAKQPSTQPQVINFANRSEMRLHHLSVGVKKWLNGSFRNTEQLTLYLTGGFGLIMGKAFNTFNVAVDTSLYTIQDNIVSGSGDFKRLSLDLSAGLEYPMGYAFFIFSEARVMIPTTSYPSNYLLKNNNAPFLGSLNIGVRIIFNDDQEE